MSKNPFHPGDRRLTATATAGLVFMLALIAVEFWDRSLFITDSWTYFELARSISGDFYRVGARTAFLDPSPYSALFPPVWPLALHVAQSIGGANIRVGIFTNFVIFALFIVLLENLARRVWSLHNLGLITGLALLGFWPFVEDMLRGSAMAITSLLILGQLYVFERWRGRVWMPLAVGALAGAAVMARFDFLPCAIALIVVVGVFERSVAGTLLSATALTIVVSPWILYSEAHFGQPFVSESSIAARSIDLSAVSWDYFPRPPISLSDQPVAWVGKLMHFLPGLLIAIAKAFGMSVSPVILILFSIYLSKGRINYPRDWRTSSEVRYIAFGAVLAFSLAGYLATGYLDQRYYTPLVWYLVFGTLIIIAQNAATVPTWAIVAGIVGIVAVGASRVAASAKMMPAFEDPTRFYRISECLNRAGASGSERILFLTDPAHAGVDDEMAAEFAPRTGRLSSMQPHNWDRLSNAELGEFFHRYGVAFFYARNEKALGRLAGKAEVERLTGCELPVYRLTN